MASSNLGSIETQRLEILTPSLSSAKPEERAAGASRSLRPIATRISTWRMLSRSVLAPGAR